MSTQNNIATNIRHPLRYLLVGLLCMVSAAAVTTGCGNDDDDSDPGGTDDLTVTDGSDGTGGQEIVSLAETYEDYFWVGAAIDGNSYKDDHVSLLQKHFNAVVCENEMKWVSLQPTEGDFTFDLADKMVAFAAENDMPVRGHTLVWHNEDQMPGWAFKEEPGSSSAASKELVLQRMRDHITTVMTHFKGKVYAWDVVNEVIVPVNEDGEEMGEDLAGVASWEYRNSKWYQICGEDYIIGAFRAAREADPDAKLFYNDYWNYLDGKRAAIIDMIEKLQAEDLIDGIGLQCHLNIDVAQEKMDNQTVYQTVENLEREIQEYAALGLDVHITELDISIYTRDYTSGDESKWYTEDELNDEYQDKLAARYKAFFDMFRENSDLISNVTFWGIADDNTWLSEFDSGRPDHPLLFDKQLEPKKAFFAVTDF